MPVRDKLKIKFYTQFYTHNKSIIIIAKKKMDMMKK